MFHASIYSCVAFVYERRRIAALDAGALDAAVAVHLADLQALAPGKDRIVDKMPANYKYLGLGGCCF